MEPAAQPALSARQSQIASMITRGMSSREIADMLVLSVRTVETHVAAIYNKLGVNSRRELLTMLLRHSGRDSATVSRAAYTNLPIPRTRLIGRESDVATILSLLAESPLVTVTGTGGVGKTRTALAVGEAFVEQGQTGVWLVELAPLSQGALVTIAVAQALKVKEAPDRELLDTLLAIIGRQSLLLVLDNCEHVIADAAKLADVLLQSCPNLRILATSREPLRSAGELTYRLPSLPFPTPGEALRLTSQSATAFAALTLFEQNARAVDHGFGLNTDNLPAIAAICRRLDGIPLAIELAAARVNVLPLGAIAGGLDERFTILAGGRRAAPSRHQTMRGLIDWSYALLDDRERALFRFLGVFVNGFLLEGAVAICHDSEIGDDTVFELLASLVNKSLVSAEPQGHLLRYHLLESTRAFALEQLVAANEHEALAARHLRYLRDRFVKLRSDAQRSARTADLRSAFTSEIGDLRAAFDHGLSCEIVMGAELLTAFSHEWYEIGLTHEGLRRGEQYLAVLPPNESSLRSRIASTSSFLLDQLGQHQRALGFAERAVALARESHDDIALAFALVQCTFPKLQLGRIGEVAAELDEADTLAGTIPLLRLALLFRRALLYRWTGDIDRALSCHDELQRQYRAQGETLLGVSNLAVLAELEHGRGATRRAVELVRENIRTLRSCDESIITPNGRAESMGMQLMNLAGYLCAIDEPNEAQLVARDAVTHLSIGNRNYFVALSMEHLALALALRGQCVAAARLAGYADSLVQRVGSVREFTEQTTFDRLRRTLDDQLSNDECRSLLADGAGLTHEAAIDLALNAHIPSAG